MSFLSVSWRKLFFNGKNFSVKRIQKYRKGAIMFNITVVVFSLVIGALAHKLYLEKKMARGSKFGPLAFFFEKSNRYDSAILVAGR